ncbi:nucleotidyltransferase family protein [Streptomyces sp. KAI-26]|uniref:nucleotidyltransferase domain-containing protein n=1 Tax=Streptomyces sp. KAI-26 TaxID=1169747 RepID=UPI001587D1BA|nr:nucleotidyltransferase family protein [Streptomyces sp. KAI-26]NUV87803.1 nucleotidyltransferase family protein [Streptomyces sp. KAI-26]NUW20265.1 nucleotidyltransferase family protein [Streptomyces roseoviolaceus]
MHISESPKLRPEIELLLTLADIEIDESRIEDCRTHLANHGRELDWGFFVDQAARQRLLPLVARNILHHGLHRSVQGPSLIPYHWLYTFAYHGNKNRNSSLGNEFGKVISALNAAGLHYAIRKGPVLGERIYRDVGLRPISDLDIIVEKSDTSTAGSVLGSLGYIQGKLTLDGERLEPFKRGTKAFWRLNMPVELPYQKICGSDGIETYIIDICSNIFQTRPDGAQFTRGLLERRIQGPLCGEQGFTLAPEDEFLDLCANLHMEATALYYVTEGGDLDVLKFLDIALVCRRISEANAWPAVRQRSKDLGVVESVYYALHHAALLYPNAVPAVEISALRPADCGYLDEYGAIEGKPQRWSQPFLQRLFDSRRTDEVGGSNPIPRH